MFFMFFQYNSDYQIITIEVKYLTVRFLHILHNQKLIATQLLKVCFLLDIVIFIDNAF